MLGGRTAGKGGWAGCSLDPGGCLSLQQILASFTAPISEEHAWAVIHQVMQEGDIDPGMPSFQIWIPTHHIKALSRGNQFKVTAHHISLRKCLQDNSAQWQIVKAFFDMRVSEICFQMGVHVLIDCCGVGDATIDDAF